MTEHRMTADEYQRKFGRNPKLPLPTIVNGAPVRATPLTEKEVQRQIIKALKTLGYNVDETSQRRASTVSIGIADLLVNRDAWGPIWLQMEVKRCETAKRSPNQADRERRGIMVVVWSAESAIRVAEQWRKKLEG